MKALGTKMKLLIVSAASMLALTACDQLGLGGGNATDNAAANAATANEVATPADANAAKPAEGADNAATPAADPAASGDKPAEGGPQPDPVPGEKPTE